MAKFGKVRTFFIVVALLLGLWNYFLRESLAVPGLSDLSSGVVWAIAIGIVVLVVLFSWKKKK